MAGADERERLSGGTAGIDELLERLVPGLARRLNDSVHEIEIGRDGWRVRVRRGRPATAPRVATPISAASGAAGHASANGSGPAGGAPPPAHGPHLPHVPRPATAISPARSAAGPGRRVATSPAVGVFMPRGDVGLGARVRAGDRLGIVDLLGVPQDVVAPSDGILTSALVEPGEGVEYGQELLVIEASA